MRGDSSSTRLSIRTASRVGHSPSHEDLSVLAGQHVIYTYPGITPPDRLYDLLRAGKVGGLILFRENIDQTNLTNTAVMVAGLQQAYAKSPAYGGFPLPIMADQEGGSVKRITNGGPFQSAKKMGASLDPAAASAKGGSDAADALIAAGININLAPVLDVYRAADNFMDHWERSFGNTSSLVSTCVVPFIKALQGKGIVATAKHFPGNGANPAGNDTDAGVVSLDMPLHEIRAVDEVPYRAAFKAGLRLIMASWVKYTAMDDRPVGISKKWIRGELRGRLGFDGVVMTDALGAGAVKQYGDWSTVALLAKQAGVDFILCASRNLTQGELAMQGIVQGLRNGHLSRHDLDASTARIMALRETLLL
ncbi:glycosyl hydrolase [Thelonectria olida]|uniref:Glycosyl hydrolase n=1 Tax=Thelonectria olida TaxID=1576542 RepID=A0A9P8VVE9_9HYPO|nr:glycosyl hydrolase [Thelonectria olida]